MNQIDVNKQFSMGWLPQRPDFRDFQLAAIEASVSFPAKIDLRPTVPIYNQLSIGSCVSNATLAMFRFVDKKQGGADEEPSRLFNYYEARKLGGLLPQDIGAYNRDGVKVCATLGSAQESDWPYDISKYNQTPPQIAYTNALDHQSLAYFAVDISEQGMKGCLTAGYPFIVGHTLYQNFYNANNDGMIPMPSGSVIGGHCLMYVGYDDSMQRYIVQGSWGSWGDRGFIYIPYSYAHNQNLTADAWTIRRVEEGFVPPPPPDPSFVQFDGKIIKGRAGKVIVQPYEPLLKNIAGRQVRITFVDGFFNGKVKSMDTDWIVIKPTTFNPTWDLKNESVHIETIDTL